MRTRSWCRRRATEIGPAATAVISELLAENALFRLRAAQGVLGLAERHDPARLEAACVKATAAEDPSYRTIKGILAAGTETTATARATGDASAPAHLHGPDQLFADTLTLIDPPDDVGVGDVVADVIPLPTAHRGDAAATLTATRATTVDNTLTSSEGAS